MSVQVGSAYVALGTEDAGFSAGLRNAEREAHSFASRVSGSLARIGEIAAGTLIGNVLPRLTAGFAGLAKEGLGAVADYERLGMSLESLVAKELRKASVETETHVIGQRRVELTEKEAEKLKDLGMQRDLLAAKLQEESERHRQLVAQWGEEGLAVKTHAASMAILQEKYNDTGGAIAALEGKQGKLVSVTETTSKTTLSMADALQQAGPKAKELIRWIEMLAVKSPFKQEDVAGAFRMAQAYGFVSDSADKNVVSAKRLTTSLIDFTSATGATGPTMERIALALGQIQAKGKLAGQEVMQLTEAGISVDAILAGAFGKSTQEIVAMREKGLIPADKAILAIVQSLEQDFGGAAAKQAGTFAGLISTLSDVKTIGLREFFTGAFEAAKPLLDGLTNMLVSEGFMTKLSEMGTALGGFITTLITKGQELVTAFQSGGFGGVLTALGISPEVTTLLTNLTTGIGSLGQVITGTVIPALQNLAGMVMPAISAALAFVNQHWEAFKGALIGVAAVLAGAAIVGAIAGLAGTLAALVNPVTLLIGLAAALGAAWATNFGGIQTKVNEVWGVIQPVFESIKQVVGNAVEMFTALRGSGEDMGTALSGAFSMLGRGVVELTVQFGVFDEVKAIIVSVQEGWAALVDFFTPTIERLKESFGQMVTSLEPIGGKLEELWQAAEPVLSTLAAVIGGVVVGAFNLLLEVVAAVMPSVGGIIGNAIDATTALFQFIGTTIQTVVGMIKAIMEGDWAAVWEGAKTLFGSFVDTLSTLLGLLWDSFSTLFTDLVQAIGNWIGNIDAEAGARFQEFVTGIGQKFVDVYEKVKTGMGQAVDYIRKIDLAEIGRNLITSLANALWNRATTYLREKAQGIASLLPEWVKRMLGIASPSRVFYEIGLNIISGLVEGMEYRTPEALEAMASVLGSIGDILEGMFKLGNATVVVSGWADKLRGLTAQMQELYVIFNEFAAWSFNNGNVMEALADVGSQMSSVTGGIIDTIEAMAALGSWKAIEDVPGKLRDLMETVRQTVIAFAGLADQEGIEEAASITAPLVLAAQAVGDIAAAWAKVGSFVQGTLDVQAVTQWLADFANLAVSALVAAQGQAATLPEKFAEFIANLRLTVTMIGDLAKAWETVRAFKWADKDWSVSAVLDFLTAFGGMATQFVTALNRWAGFDVKAEVVTQVKTAVQLIADIAGAWEDVRSFKWLPKETDVTGIQQFLVAFGGFAARFVTALNSWAGIDVKTERVTQVRTAVSLLADIAGAWERVQAFKWAPKETNVPAIQEWLVAFGGFAARFVTALNNWTGIQVDEKVVGQVRAAVSLIADIAGAWEKVQTFKAKPKGMDVGKVVQWLASFGGQVTAALAEVSTWKQFKGLGEEFQAFLDNFKAVMSAASDALKFANELGAWKMADDLPDRFLRLRNDFEAIIMYVIQMRSHLGDLVTSDLVKFVRYVGDLSDGLISAVKLMAELANLRRFDIVGAVNLLATMVNQFLDGLEVIIEGLTERQAELTEAFGQALQSLMEGLQAALELALTAPERWGAPNETTWASFLTWVTLTFDWFRVYVEQQYADENGPERMGLVGAFAGALGALMGGLKSALELALSLPANWAPPSMTNGPWVAFIQWIRIVFQNFYDWINRTGAWEGLPIPFGADGLDLVKKFGEALGALMGGLKSALELALAVPANWTPPSMLNGPWVEFIQWVRVVFQNFYDWINRQGAWQGLPIPFGADGLDLVKKFGEALGTLMGGLKGALELALAVPANWTPPSFLNGPWVAFVQWVRVLFTNFYDWINRQGAWQGLPIPFGADGLDLVKKFGEALGVLMTGLKGALDLALGLPENWTAPGAYWNDFVAWVQGVFTAFLLYVQRNFPADSEAAKQMPMVKAFGEAMGAVFGGLKSAMDVFAGLAGYIPILRSRFADFLANVTFAFEEVRKYATGKGVQDGLAATTAFAQAASAVFQALGAALQVFGQLVEGTNTPIDTFKTRLQSLVQRISITLTAWKTYIQTEAAGNWTPASNTFVSVLNSVLDTLKRGLDLFVALNQSGLPSPNQITAFVNAILDLFARLTSGIIAVPGQLDRSGTGIGNELRSWPVEWQPLLNGYGGFGQSLAQSLSYGFHQQITNAGASWAGGRMVAALQAIMTTMQTTPGNQYRDVLGFLLGAKVFEGMTAAFSNTTLRGNIGVAIGFNLSTGQGLATWMLTTFGPGWVQAGYWLGSNVAFGISDGLKNMAAAIKITDSVTVVIEAIKQAIKTAFGIRSPSRVTAGYGEQIAAGLAVGMLAGVAQVSRAGDALAAAVGPYMGQPVGSGDYRLQSERRIVVVFEGAAGGGVPLSPTQFSALKKELAYALVIGA